MITQSHSLEATYALVWLQCQDLGHRDLTEEAHNMIIATSAQPRQVFGESREGWSASHEEPLNRYFGSAELPFLRLPLVGLAEEVTERNRRFTFRYPIGVAKETEKDGQVFSLVHDAMKTFNYSKPYHLRLSRRG